MIFDLAQFCLEHWEKFELGLTSPKRLHALIRTSSWLSDEGKIVYLLFRENHQHPVLIAKTMHNQCYAHRLETEYQNLRYIRGAVAADVAQRLPRPLGIYTVLDRKIYLEVALPGSPLPKVMSHCRDLGLRQAIIWRCFDLWSKIFMPDRQTHVEAMVKKSSDLVFSPMENLIRLNNLNMVEARALNQALAVLAACPVEKMTLGCAHGDFWGGSILLDNGEPYIIDWETLDYAAPPLWDLFMMACHPGFVATRKGRWSLLNEFKVCFSDNWYTKVWRNLFSVVKTQTDLDFEQLRVLFITFLAAMTVARDHRLETGNHDGNGKWRALLRYYCEHECDLSIFEKK